MGLIIPPKWPHPQHMFPNPGMVASGLVARSFSWHRRRMVWRLGGPQIGACANLDKVKFVHTNKQTGSRPIVVYTAQLITDAYLIKGLLENNGISAFVAGDYLQGALGGLPVSGLITVSVEEPDASAASNLVMAFERSQPGSQ